MQIGYLLRFLIRTSKVALLVLRLACEGGSVRFNRISSLRLSLMFSVFLPLSLSVFGFVFFSLSLYLSLALS